MGSYFCTQPHLKHLECGLIFINSMLYFLLALENCTCLAAWLHHAIISELMPNYLPSDLRVIQLFQICCWNHSSLAVHCIFLSEWQLSKSKPYPEGALSPLHAPQTSLLNGSVNQFESSHISWQENCRPQQNNSVNGIILHHSACCSPCPILVPRENFFHENCQNSKMEQLSEEINLLHGTAIGPPEEAILF